MAKSKLIEVLQNEHGTNRTRPFDPDDARAKYLGYMLSDGIQGSLRSSKEALEQVIAVQRGGLDRAVIGGNDLEMTLTSDGAVLEHNIFPDDPSYQYDLEEIRAALEDWRDLLKMPRS